MLPNAPPSNDTLDRDVLALAFRRMFVKVLERVEARAANPTITIPEPDPSPEITLTPEARQRSRAIAREAFEAFFDEALGGWTPDDEAPDDEAPASGENTRSRR